MVDMRTPMSNRDPPAKKLILRIPLLLLCLWFCGGTMFVLFGFRRREPVYINFDISKIFSSSRALSLRAATQDNAVTRLRFGGKCVTLAKITGCVRPGRK